MVKKPYQLWQCAQLICQICENWSRLINLLINNSLFLPPVSKCAPIAQ